MCFSDPNLNPNFIFDCIATPLKSDDCNWILRSPETEEFDLLNVPSNWQVWTGVISTTEVHTACNECNDATDCNLNGQCVEGSCKCDNTSGVRDLFAKQNPSETLSIMLI